jgi:hypothetical protein
MRCALAVLLLTYCGVAHAAPTDARTKPESPPRTRKPALAFRGGAEWGTIHAPLAVAGDYVRPDGSASVNFYDWSPARQLIAGRLEIGPTIQLPRGNGLFGRVGMAFGSSPVETQSLVVAGVPLEYPSHQMFFAFTGGAEVQLLRRMLGLGFDFGWAASWDPTRPSFTNELELVRHSSSGPYWRLAATARLPSKGLFGVGLFVAVDTYLTWDNSLGANSRASLGAFIELDGSR